jgi:hypothetical protein
MLSSLGGGGGLLARVLLKNQCSSSSSSSAGEPFGGGGGGGELMPALLCVGRGWMDDENGIVDGLLSCDDLPACFCLLLGCDELQRQQRPHGIHPFIAIAHMIDCNCLSLWSMIYYLFASLLVTSSIDYFPVLSIPSLPFSLLKTKFQSSAN